MSSKDQLSVSPLISTKKQSQKPKDRRTRTLAAAANAAGGINRFLPGLRSETQRPACNGSSTDMHEDMAGSPQRTSRELGAEAFSHTRPHTLCRMEQVQDLSSQLRNANLNETGTSSPSLKRAEQQRPFTYITEIEGIRNMYPDPREQIPVCEQRLALLEWLMHQARVQTPGIEILQFRRFIAEQKEKVRRIDALVVTKRSEV
jgi:hypothetical protein